MGDYQRLQTDAETEILPSIEPKIHRPFYFRALFVLSLISVFCVVIFFLWGLPCDFDSCSQKHPISWDKPLYYLELKGRMHLVGGHLICILRAALWGKSSTSFPPHTGGVIALSVSTGDLVWYVPLPHTPDHIDCTLLGKRLCLVFGKKGFLMAIDYISGIHVWRMRSLNTTVWPQPEEIDFPLSIPGRGELITLSRFKNGVHRLLFISMETGVVVSEPPVNSECDHVYNLTYSFDGYLHYTCDTGLGVPPIISVRLDNHKGHNEKGASEPVDYTKRLKGEDVHGDQQIIVTNSGSCPRSCEVSITVTNSSNVTVWYYGAKKTYAMALLPLRFRPHITGFLIKLWQWHDQPIKLPNVTIEMIKERIVLITFNKSESMHVVNASQTDITRLCSVDRNECQPELTSQTQSALLVDVNGDGWQDLISYFVTYHPQKEEDRIPEHLKDWELLTKVRVVHLEAELPKLYDAVSKH